MEGVRKKVERQEATINQLTRANLDKENQLIEVNRELKATRNQLARARDQLARAAQLRRLEREIVSTKKKETLGYKLKRSVGKISRELEHSFPITLTSLEEVFQNGEAKTYDVRVLNSKDIVEQLRLTTPAIILRLKKELATIGGLKFKMTLKVTLLDPNNVNPDDPTDLSRTTMNPNSSVRVILDEAEIEEAFGSVTNGYADALGIRKVQGS